MHVVTCVAGLNPVLSPDARAYKSVDPLETRGSDLYKSTSPPGRNGFLGNNGNGNRIAGDTQFLYTNYLSTMPDGSGQGEWCTVWTTTNTGSFTPDVRGWNDLTEAYNYNFMCMDIPGTSCARSGCTAATTWAAQGICLPADCKQLQTVAMHAHPGQCSRQCHLAVLCAGPLVAHAANRLSQAWSKLNTVQCIGPSTVHAAPRHRGVLLPLSGR